MSESMSIEDYLAQGGVLTSPANVPPRYRGELLRIMATFVDSELAASAGFADMINAAPGIRERIAASRIVLEKTDHAGRVLVIMSSFGADAGRYAVHHDWAARVSRHASIGAGRFGSDMRLSVFHFPLHGWVDAVVMNVLMGIAGGIQLRELSHVSYAPLADVFRDIAPREAEHTALGLEGLTHICASDAGRTKANESAAFWYPHVAATFGQAGSGRFETLRKLGLRHRMNEVLMAEWQQQVMQALSGLGIAI